MATARQIRFHVINMRSLRVSVRIIRAGIISANNRNEDLLFEAAIQYLMPKSLAAAEKILKADADNFADAFGAMFEQELDVLMIEGATISGNAWIGTLNPQLGLNFRDRTSIEWLHSNGLDLATSMADSVKPQLREALAQAIVDGDVSVQNMKRLLRESLSDWEGWRLERLARTEGNAAMSAGTLEAYKASEVVDRKEWFNPDPQAAPCILNNGQIVNLDESFRSGHSRPPAHVNCESSILPILK